MKLIEEWIADLDAPPGRKTFWSSTSMQRGLDVRVTSSGGKSFWRSTLSAARSDVPARRAHVRAGAIGGGQDHGRSSARPRSGRRP